MGFLGEFYRMGIQARLLEYFVAIFHGGYIRLDM